MTVYETKSVTDHNGSALGFNLITRIYNKVIAGIVSDDEIFVSLTSYGGVVGYEAFDIGYFDGIRELRYDREDYREAILAEIKKEGYFDGLAADGAEIGIRFGEERIIMFNNGEIAVRANVYPDLELADPEAYLMIVYLRPGIVYGRI